MSAISVFDARELREAVEAAVIAVPSTEHAMVLASFAALLRDTEPVPA